jgi:hypothetical protein
VIDLLALIYRGEIELEQAERIFDDELDKIHCGEAPPDWRKTLGFSNEEATAYAHGADLEDLVKLRYEGWPKVCSRCKRPLNHRVDNWLFIPSDDGIVRLKHVSCPIDLGE